jgi:subtilisin family serine protease
MFERTGGRTGHRISTLFMSASLMAGQVLLLVRPLMLAVAADPPRAESLPNDPMLAEQWYLFPPGDKRGSPGGINAIEAWRHVGPARPIVVALLDAGVNYTHPDLAANIWKNERELPNGKDDDGNGYVDDLYGWDFAYANNNPVGRRSLKFPEQFDHGTAVASLIAAVPDNRIGTAGVGRNVRIMNLRVAGDPDFEGQESIRLETTLPQAIRYAIRNGARVIVCTLGSLDPPERHFETSLKEAEEAGVLFVKSAGNQGRSIDNDQLFKFLSQYSNVIVVGGTNRDGTLSRHMNFGKRVGIAAPSVDMVFPSFDGYLRFKGPGTSFSAPIVAGVAATLLSQAPDLTPRQVIARLRDASVPASGMEGVIGGGRLDMARLFPP